MLVYSNPAAKQRGPMVTLPLVSGFQPQQMHATSIASSSGTGKFRCTCGWESSPFKMRSIPNGKPSAIFNPPLDESREGADYKRAKTEVDAHYR